MIPFKHKGCFSTVICYVGDAALTPKTIMRKADWRMPDGAEIAMNSDLVVTCPDCGITIDVDAEHLQQGDDLRPTPRAPQ